MILVIVPLLCFIELFLILGNIRSKPDWPRSFLRAAILWGAYAILTLEILSPFSGISQLNLAISWLVLEIGLGIALYQIHRRSQVLHFPTFSLPTTWANRGLLLLICLVILITFIVAWISPPQTADSYVYHMSRVAHWAQNHSIRPYVTGIRFQNTMSQGAELIVLQFYVIVGSDKLANLVQWFAMVSTLIGISLMAGKLGARHTGKLFAVAFTASLPMGIVQASSTMTDYVVTLWIVCVASEGLNVILDHSHWINAIFLGTSVGLAIATKPTSFAFLLPFAILIPAGLIQKTKLKGVFFTTIVVLFCVSILNVGHFVRNNSLYGSPLGHQGTISRHANETINGKVILSNIIRHASLHAGTHWKELNDWIYQQISKIHVKLGQDINDPKTTFTEFRILTPNTTENLTTNPIHAYLVLLTFIFSIIKHRQIKQMTLVYGIAVVSGFFVFSAMFKYQVFGSRLQLPFFVLIAPFIGIVFSSTRHRKWMPYFGIILILLSCPWLFQISSRPIIPNPDTSEVGSIFIEPREVLYFPGGQTRHVTYKTITDRIEANECNSVGLFLSGSSSEYLWWVLLDAPREDLQIEWIVSDSPTTRYEDPEFEPCAIICENCPSEWTILRGLPLVSNIDENQFKLFLKEQ